MVQQYVLFVAHSAHGTWRGTCVNFRIETFGVWQLSDSNAGTVPCLAEGVKHANMVQGLPVCVKRRTHGEWSQVVYPLEVTGLPV